MNCRGGRCSLRANFLLSAIMCWLSRSCSICPPVFARNETVHVPTALSADTGSRAVIVLCRDEEAARKHFGIRGEGIGVIY